MRALRNVTSTIRLRRGSQTTTKNKRVKLECVNASQLHYFGRAAAGNRHTRRQQNEAYLLTRFGVFTGCKAKKNWNLYSKVTTPCQMNEEHSKKMLDVPVESGACKDACDRTQLCCVLTHISIHFSFIQNIWTQALSMTQVFLYPPKCLFFPQTDKLSKIS